MTHRDDRPTDERAADALLDAAAHLEALATDFRERTPTLRDFFAAAAMSGILASGGADTLTDAVARAYRHADAMIRERGR
jgi:hypothetical protein